MNSQCCESGRAVSRHLSRKDKIMFNAIKTFFFAALVMLGFASAPSIAAPVDLTSLTTAVDFSTTTTALLGVAAALIVVYIAWKAASMVLAAVRRG